MPITRYLLVRGVHTMFLEGEYNGKFNPIIEWHEASNPKDMTWISAKASNLEKVGRYIDGGFMIVGEKKKACLLLTNVGDELGEKNKAHRDAYRKHPSVTVGKHIGQHGMHNLCARVSPS